MFTNAICVNQLSVTRTNIWYSLSIKTNGLLASPFQILTVFKPMVRWYMTMVQRIQKHKTTYLMAKGQNIE